MKWFGTHEIASATQDFGRAQELILRLQGELIRLGARFPNASSLSRQLNLLKQQAIKLDTGLGCLQREAWAIAIHNDGMALPDFKFSFEMNDFASQVMSRYELYRAGRTTSDIQWWSEVYRKRLEQKNVY